MQREKNSEIDWKVRDIKRINIVAAVEKLPIRMTEHGCHAIYFIVIINLLLIEF